MIVVAVLSLTGLLMVWVLSLAVRVVTRPPQAAAALKGGVLTVGPHPCFPPSPTREDGAGLRPGAKWRCPECGGVLELTTRSGLYDDRHPAPSYAVQAEDGAVWLRT